MLILLLVILLGLVLGSVCCSVPGVFYVDNHVVANGMCVLTHVWLFATPWAVAHQAPCPWDSPGKTPGAGAIFSSRGSSWPRDRTWVSCPGRQVPYHWATGEALSANRDTFISSFLEGLLSFYSCHRAPIRLPSTTLNNSTRINGVLISGHPRLVPNLKEKAFGLSPWASF